MRGSFVGKRGDPRRGDRRGFYFGRGTRPLFPQRNVSCAAALFGGVVLCDVRPVSTARQTVRGLSRRVARAVRESFFRRGERARFVRSRARRRHARGARRALSEGEPALFARRACRLRRRAQIRYKGRYMAQSRARARASLLCVCVRKRGNGVFLSRFRFGERVCGRRGICGVERLFDDAASDGRGIAHEEARASRTVCRRRLCGGRGVHSRTDLSRGRGRAQCRNAVFVRHAGEDGLFRCRRACDHDVARLFAVSARFACRAARKPSAPSRFGKNCRGRRIAFRGVRTFPHGAWGDRRKVVSRRGDLGVIAFSFLRF